MIRHRIKNVLKFYYRASTIYDIHSPAVYTLAQSLFTPLPESLAAKITYYKNKLYNENQLIENINLGAGSHSGYNDSKIPIRSILKTAVSGEKKLRFLHNISTHYQAVNILEMGTSLGFSALALMHPKIEKLITIEGNPNIAAIAKRMFTIEEPKKIENREGEFSNIIRQLDNEGYLPGLVYIDGNHTYEATIEYFNFFINQTAIATLILIFDDLYWSPGMTKAWEEIKLHPAVRFSIDLFDIGIIQLGTNHRQVQHFSIIQTLYKPWRMGFFPKKVG